MISLSVRVRSSSPSNFVSSRKIMRLIGREMPGDVIHQAKQVSWIDPQMRLDLDLLMLRHDEN